MIVPVRKAKNKGVAAVSACNRACSGTPSARRTHFLLLLSQATFVYFAGSFDSEGLTAVYAIIFSLHVMPRYWA